MAWVSNYCNKIVAESPGVRGELKKIRDRGVAKAEVLFAPHDQAGGAKITKSRGNADYFWSLEDTDKGDGEPAAYAIEFGYSRRGTPVQGLHIIGRSAGSL